MASASPAQSVEPGACSLAHRHLHGVVIRLQGLNPNKEPHFNLWGRDAVEGGGGGLTLLCDI